VITRQGEVGADEILLCGGAWSADLALQLGLRLPMQAGRGYSLTLPQPVQQAALCSILTEARVAVTPMGGCMRFGGTMEITQRDAPPRLRRVQGIIKSACDYFPEFKPADFAGLSPGMACVPVPGWHALRRTHRRVSEPDRGHRARMMGLSLALSLATSQADWWIVKLRGLICRCCRLTATRELHADSRFKNSGSTFTLVPWSCALADQPQHLLGRDAGRRRSGLKM